MTTMMITIEMMLKLSRRMPRERRRKLSRGSLRNLKIDAADLAFFLSNISVGA